MSRIPLDGPDNLKKERKKSDRCTTTCYLSASPLFPHLDHQIHQHLELCPYNPPDHLQPLLVQSRRDLHT